MRVFLGITGASGAPYAARLLSALVDAGCDVRYVAFSIATCSLPPGFEPDTLAREVREATDEIRISEHLDP